MREGYMPKFILDLQWTPTGLANVPNGLFRDTRAEALEFATRNGLTNIQVIDRLVPTPVGPIWIVEGQEQDVATVVAGFNIFGSVKAQYHRYTDAGELDAAIRVLVTRPARPKPGSP
jgi:hypothetical protein